MKKLINPSGTPESEIITILLSKETPETTTPNSDLLKNTTNLRFRGNIDDNPFRESSRFDSTTLLT